LKKTILLIGASGYIGKKLKSSLKKKYFLIDPRTKDGFDISKINTLKKIFNNKVDIIINLSGQINTNKKLMKKVIINGNKNIIELCKRKNTLVLYFSTSLVYGYSNKIKKENSLKRPIDDYSRYKLTAENEYLKSGINYKILRLCNIYDGKKSGIIKILIDSLIKNKEVEISNAKVFRNYLSIDDLIKIICKMLKIKLKYDIYNIGFENVKIIEIIRGLEKKLKLKINFKDNFFDLKKIPSQRISINRLITEIRYKPKINLKLYLVKKYYSEFKLLKK
jgi:nucleoside-diphosphate-sugar epimerase